MNDINKQIPPPKSWVDFENLCHSLFGAVWNDPYAEKNGRSGQKQSGVDVFGSPNQNYGHYHGVQCKGKNANYGAFAEIAEIESEIVKAENFSPGLHHWIYATTAPVDAKLQKAARKISEQRKTKGLFTVSVFGWEQIEALLCRHKDVLKLFYPELGFDLEVYLEQIVKRLSTELGSEIKSLLVSQPEISSEITSPSCNEWIPVRYGQGRGLVPALMGRSMGANDALSCPELPEVSKVIIDLSKAFATRIVGEPGSGKSLCAFQAMKYFIDRGWQILRLCDPQKDKLEIPGLVENKDTLLFIDDAHLVSPSRLSILEEQAGKSLLVLSTHNTEEAKIASRNAIAIDSQRAVNIIAKGLLVDRARTLKEVASVDKDIGDKMMQIDVDARISEAQRISVYPWQFCFNLGGGWRRATDIADSARQAKADLILAVLAAHQIVSRDRPLGLDEASELLISIGFEGVSVQKALVWLVQQRLLLSMNDLRPPHQKFSSVALNKILGAQNDEGRQLIGQAFEYLVRSNSYPLAGKRMLLHELRFAGNYGRWCHLVPPVCLQPAIQDAWQAVTPEEKLHACYFLYELDVFFEGWPEKLFAGNEETIASWISQPDTPAGWGLGRLINGIGNKDKKYLAALISKADPHSLAKEINAVNLSSAAHLGELLRSLGYVRQSLWHQQLRQSLDQKALARLATNWEDLDEIWAFAKFCNAAAGVDDDLGLAMAEKFVPCAQQAFSKDPVGAFRDLDDFMMSVLRIYDPLGVFVGKQAPTSRHKKIARKMLKDLNAGKVAEFLSDTKLREMQSAAGLLTTIYKVLPQKHLEIVQNIDWQKVSNTIGDHWSNLPHEAEVFLGVCYGGGSAQSLLDDFISQNLNKITSFPPRLAILSPNAAIRHVESGKTIRLASFDHVDWKFGYFVIALFSEKKPELLSAVLEQAEKTTAETFSRENSSWYREAYEYTNLLQKEAPESLDRILDKVSADRAQNGWIDCLQKGRGAQKTVALLVEYSLKRGDELGLMARQLRQRFPKASLPPNK